MATIKTLSVNKDDYELVQLIVQITGKTEPAAATALMEIGLYNILKYPTGNKDIDVILSADQWPEVVTRVKAHWRI